jgi:dephospho-CoA kinase
MGITGTNGAGKGTVVDYLIKKKGFKHFSASGLITEELIKKNRPVNRDNMILMGNELRAKNGANYLARELLRRASKENANSIIESIRTPGEVEELKKNNGILIAVEANQRLRYERNLKRGSTKDKVSFEEFVAQEKQEMVSDDPNKQNLSACKKAADYVIENNGTIDELNQKVKELLIKIIKDVK